MAAPTAAPTAAPAPASASSTDLGAGAWVPVCRLDRIAPGAGVAARLGDVAVAIYRVVVDGVDRVYALDDRDPFTGVRVLSRGIVGDRDGVLKVSSPLHKQSFALATGACLDDPARGVAVFDARVVDGVVELWRASGARAA